MLITDLSYDWDNEVPWEISTTEKLNGPMYTQVSISFTVLGSKKPSTSSPIYDIAKTKEGENVSPFDPSLFEQIDLEDPS